MKIRRRYDRDFKISVVDELERLLGRSQAENELLKKALVMSAQKVQEERKKPRLRAGL